MKPEDVMKALECCTFNPKCDECPLGGEDCINIEQLALALLREKDAEIERLTKERDYARRDCAVAEQLHYECKKELEEISDDILDSVRAERDRYKAESERYQGALLKARTDAEQERFKCKNICEPTYKNLLETARAEAITEFEKKLMEKKCHYTETEHTFDFDGVTVEDIEQTAKELKGEPDEL